MRIVLLGPPGAGKGTQADLIAAQKHVAHVASGNLFRKHLGEGTELGKLAKTFMDRGELVPDGVTVSMVLDRIAEADAADGYVLDGFPRTMDQAKALDEALAGKGQAIDVTPLVEVETEELVRRLAGRWICRSCQTPYHEFSAPPKATGICDVCGGELYQRDDDKPEVVRARLETYERQTAPLIEYYEGEGKLVRVDGQRDVEKVTSSLLQAVGERSAA
jgi:adenylate kinase